MLFRVGATIVAVYAAVRVIGGMALSVTVRLSARRAFRKKYGIHTAAAGG